jgi:hypothetical protein
VTAAQPRQEFRADVDVLLSEVVGIVSCFAHISRFEAWWHVVQLTDPGECGLLSPAAWRALASLALCQADSVEALPCAPPGWHA